MEEQMGWDSYMSLASTAVNLGVNIYLEREKGKRAAIQAKIKAQEFKTRALSAGTQAKASAMDHDLNKANITQRYLEAENDSLENRAGIMGAQALGVASQNREMDSIASLQSENARNNIEDRAKLKLQEKFDTEALNNQEKLKQINYQNQIDGARNNAKSALAGADVADAQMYANMAKDLGSATKDIIQYATPEKKERDENKVVGG